MTSARPETRRPAWLPLVLLLAATAPPVPARAGGEGGQAVEVGDLDLDALLDPELASASLHAERSSAAPASVFVLTRQDLRDHGFETLAEALRSVPGLFTYSDGFYQYVGVRGTGLLVDYTRRLLVLVDGHPLNDGLGIAESNLGRDLPLPLAVVERIEVVKGPVGGVYGPAAFLGVVNVVTRSAAEPGWQAAASGDLAQAKVVAGHLVVAGAGSLGSVSVTAGAEVLQARGYTWTFPELAGATDRPAPPGGRVARMDGSDAVKGYLRADSGPASLLAGCGHWKRGLPTAPYSATLLDAANHEESLACFAQVGAEVALLRDVTLYGRLAYDHFDYRDLLIYPPPGPGGDVGPWRDAGTDGWLSAEGRVTWTPAAAWRLLAGATGEAHQTSQRAGSDLLPTILADPENGIGVGTIRKDFVTSAVYGLAVWDVAPGLVLHGGLSWYHHQLFGSRLTPRAAAVWRPGPRDALKVIYAEGFRAPSVAEAYFNDVTDSIPNPALRPERAATWELAYERRLEAGVTLAASVFQAEYRDLISLQTVPAPGVNAPDPANPADFRQQNQNLGAFGVVGGEASATVRWRDWLTAFGGVSVQRASHERPNFPGVTANLALSGVTPWRPLRLTARAAFASGRDKPLEGLLPGQATAVPWLLRLDLAASLRVPGTEGLFAEASLLNVLDRRTDHPVAADFAPISQLAEAPRTLRLGLRYQR